MKYNYYPDSFNYNLIKSNFADEDEFINLSVKYKQHLENILNKIIDFKKINDLIKSKNIEIPLVEDKQYNFYHKYSVLNSDYIFLRNNIHLENLSVDELNELKNGVDDKFIMNTLQKVIYEKGDKTFVGIPNDFSMVDSKSVFIEFAYDQKKCESIDQLRNIGEIVNTVFDYIEKDLSKYKMPLSLTVYDAIPDIYKQTENVVTK
ncbi:MAG: hypothetical protein IKD77_01285 [Bacilli bacterium]|nr:hypothetical protein [Bacilli bacterium]